MNLTGILASYWPRQFKTRSTWRLTKLGGPSGEWHRWASAAALSWKPSAGVDRIPLFQIHGDRDSTFPIRYTVADTVIYGGGHVLPLSHSQEIAEKLLQIAA